MYNLLIGGAAGQGVDTITHVLERFIKHAGCGVFTTRDLMSRIRGGHNFALLRFGQTAPSGHDDRLDGLIALNEETLALHLPSLDPQGFALTGLDSDSQDPRVIKLDSLGIAKSLGNQRAAGSVALGAALKLLGIPFTREAAGPIFARYLKEDLVPVNVQAAQAGHESVSQLKKPLQGPYDGHLLLSGAQALCFGAMAAGLQFYAAYPMSPSTSILEHLAQHAGEVGYLVEQAEDEIAAINMALGASYAGARAMTGTSGGGFSLMVEGLGLAGMGEIPLVVVNAMRPGPATGLPTRTEQSDLRFVISAAQGEFPRMVIALRNHEDAFHQTARAFEMAEKYQIPVILLTDQYLQEATATIPLPNPYHIRQPQPLPPEGKGEYARYRYTKSGISPRILPGDPRGFSAVDSDEHDEEGRIIEDADTRVKMMDKRMGKLALLKKDLQEPEHLGEKEPDILLIGWGSMDGPLREAVDLLNAGEGPRVGALVFGDVWPLPERRLRKYAQQAKQRINVEQNYTGQLAQLIREQTGIAMDASVLKYDGRQLTGAQIADRVTKEAGK